MSEWIKVEDKKIDLNNCSFILVEGIPKPLRLKFSIFEHQQVLWDLFTATHWMEIPKPPSFNE